MTSQPLLSVPLLCNYLFSSSHFSSRCFSLSSVLLEHFIFSLLLLFFTHLMVVSKNLVERLEKHQGKFFYLCECVCVCLHMSQSLQYFAADLIEYSGCTECLEYFIASIIIQKVSIASVPPFHDGVPVQELAHLCTSCEPRWPLRKPTRFICSLLSLLLQRL